MKELHNVRTRLERTPPSEPVVLLRAQLGQLRQPALEGADTFAVDENLRQTVIHCDVHINRIVIQSSVPSHIIEIRFELFGMEFVRYADSRWKNVL